MLESHTENTLATWTVSQCAFTVEYSLRVMDDIRLAVVDAFFSLPRGGAEIGGILLGKHEGRRVTITGHVPLDCEHATGPSFVLSSNDHTKLAEILAAARGNPSGTQPVGWYHSHTRSDIHLSAADLAIHKRYFPEPWQIALVLKPHTFQPARAGLFFWEADGSIRATASYKEFVLEPLGVRTLPTTPAPNPPRRSQSEPIPSRRPQSEPAGTVIPMVARPQPEARSAVRSIDVAPLPIRQVESPPEAELRSAVHRIDEPRLPTPPVESPPETEPATRPETIQVTPPAFTQAEPTRSWGMPGVLVALSVGLVLGAAAYQTRQYWLPRSMRPGQAVPAPAARAYIGLTTLDNDGQLQIRWDRDSPAVRDAEQGSLVIEDGPVPRAILLDPAHLRTGTFTYGRQTERVDVALTVHGPTSQTVREVATYLGNLPPADPAGGKQRDDATKELRGRTKKLEKTVEDLRKELRQRKRMENQSPDSVK